MGELKPCPFTPMEIADIIEKLIPEIECYMTLYKYQQSALHGAVVELRRTQGYSTPLHKPEGGKI